VAPQTKILVAAVVAAVVGGILFTVFFTDNEPSYNGRSLSQWSQDWHYAQDSKDTLLEARAYHAISAIGTNAVPYALEKVRVPYGRGAPRFLRRIPYLGGWLNDYRWKKDYTKTAAADLFHILGSKCSFARPALTKLIDETKDDNVRTRATFCLAAIGDDAKPELITILTNTNHPSWADVIYFIARDEFKLEAVRQAAIPHLINFASSDRKYFATRSIRTLGKIGGDEQVVLPALINAFSSSNSAVRIEAVRALREWKQPTMVEQALSDPDENVRVAATNAMKRLAETAP
jgi:hypothetical protein